MWNQEQYVKLNNMNINSPKSYGIDLFFQLSKGNAPPAPKEKGGTELIVCISY